MGGDSQPFLYDRPSKYSFVGPSEKGFNPRVASEASWTTPVPKPKWEGPLIQSKDFNRHPDSYFVVPYGNLNWKAMSPRTKDKVKCTRLTLLILRILSLLGAGGMLFCVICIRNTGPMTAWIIRVPAGIAILHSIYAVYHLARFSRGRTPASSASYMLFAAVIDISLIPFYVFAALMARVEYVEPAGTPDRWLTLFSNDDTAYKVIYSTFLISVTCGGLHLISFILSMYLGVLYRKISRLPPDMNPLEDNLTSRHKRSKSSLMENRNSQASSTNLKGGTESPADGPLTSPIRTIPFMHTRNDSHLDMSDQSPPRASPVASQASLSIPLHDRSSPNRSSNISLASSQCALPNRASPNSPSRDDFFKPTRQSQHPTIPNLSPQQNLLKGSLPRHGQSQEQQQPIVRSLTKSSSIYSCDTTTATNTTMNASSKSNFRPLLENNWITHPSSASPHSPAQSREVKKAAYQPLSQVSNYDFVTNDENQYHRTTDNPLEMNPPMPNPDEWKQPSLGKNGQGALAPSDGNGRLHGIRNQGPGTLGIGKTRSWDGMSGLVGRRNEGARVVSRSGVQVRGEGILPSGGVRAREVSGKVMEEGREMANWHLVSD